MTRRGTSSENNVENNPAKNIERPINIDGLKYNTRGHFAHCSYFILTKRQQQ